MENGKLLILMHKIQTEFSFSKKVPKRENPDVFLFSSVFVLFEFDLMQFRFLQFQFLHEKVLQQIE